MAVHQIKKRLVDELIQLEFSTFHLRKTAFFITNRKCRYTVEYF